MAHFAKIENGTVTQVIVVSNDDCAGGDYPEACAAGNAFINSLAGLEGTWKQTSYNNNFRGKYAGLGDTLDEVLDEFVSPVVIAVPTVFGELHTDADPLLRGESV